MSSAPLDFSDGVGGAVAIPGLYCTPVFRVMNSRTKLS